MEQWQDGFWTALLMLMFNIGGTAPEPPRAVANYANYLAGQVRDGDSWGMTFTIGQAYEAAGISTNDTLTWQFQPYDGIVNWYNPYTEVINLSELPTDAEIAPYWDNWSQTLTRGRWDWRAFFADEAEARDMARFNQFVLAAHEYGHALTYRFDPDHVARADNAVNCREFPADRLAAGLLEDLADASTLFAQWRDRYGDLAAAINTAISDTERYERVTFASLEADCRVLDVAQPDETSMTPYASAYFVRWQALVEIDLPPLPEIYETHLLGPWRARQIPGAPLARSVDFVDWIYADLTGNFERGDETVWRHVGFAPDGRLFALHHSLVNQDGVLSLSLDYGPAGAKTKSVLAAVPLDLDIADPTFFDFTSFLSLGPDHFLLASSDLWGESDNMVLLDLRREADGWRLKALQPLPGEQNAETRLVHAAGGKVILDLYQFGASEPSGWKRFDLDPETLAVAPTGTVPDSPYQYFGQMPDGRDVLIDTDNPMVLLREPGASPVRIAGNGLQGFKDMANPLNSEFANIATAIPLEDRIRLLDYDPIAHQFSVRDVVLK